MKEAPEAERFETLFDKMDVLLARVESVADRLIVKLEAMEARHE